MNNISKVALFLSLASLGSLANADPIDGNNDLGKQQQGVKDTNSNSNFLRDKNDKPDHKMSNSTHDKSGISKSRRSAPSRPSGKDNYDAGRPDFEHTRP